MKKYRKYLILLAIVLSVFGIYHVFASSEINYIALGDSVAEGRNPYGEIGYGYADYLRDMLSEKKKLKYYQKYAKSGYQTRDMITKIQEDNQLKKDFPLYQNQFDMFADHSMGLLQGNIWNALAELKMGASLQHYNPLIDDEVKRQWEIPEYYRLTAQMVFGGIGSIPEPKEKMDADDRVIVYSNNS